MIKKIGIVILILVASVSSLSAGSDWHFLCDAVDQHPEVLWGFLPTYIYGGVGYRGLQILDENTTDIQLLFGAGYIQRKLWQDPQSGDDHHAGDDPLSMRENPITYDVFVIDWGLRFRQGFFHSPWDAGSDLLTVTLGYEGKYEQNMNSMVLGKDRTNWSGPFPVQTLDSYLVRLLITYTGNVGILFYLLTIQD